MRKFIVRLPINQEVQSKLIKIALEEEITPYVNYEGLNFIAAQSGEDKFNELFRSLPDVVIVDSATEEVTFIEFL